MSRAAGGDVAMPDAAAAGGRAGRRAGWAAVIAVVSSCAFVAFVSQLPVAILADAGYDDGWFWQRAMRIAGGGWMGGYDGMTLIKGAGYPLFLALAHVSGLSSMAAQAWLYASACLLLGAAVHRASGRPWLALVIVMLVQWHPAALAWARVLRDAIGAAQLLGIAASLVMFVHAARVDRRGWRWAVLAGWLAAWMWTTREDGIWVVPGLAVLVLVPLVQAWPDSAERRRLVVGVALAVLAGGAWLSLVAATNFAKYGVFATVETRDTHYADALAALQRVRVGAPVAHVPVPRAVRDAVAQHSPAFARLQAYFDGPGQVWTGPGCSLYPHTCGDIAGGWFMWALREGAASIGEHRSAAAADAYYAQVAREVEAACASGRLACPAALPGMPPATPAQWATLPERVGRSVAMLLWQGIGEGQTESHRGSPRARQMWEFLGQPRVPDPAAALGAAAGSGHDGIPPDAEARMAWRWVKHWIGMGYAAVLPTLAAAGLLAFGWAVWRAARTRRLEPLLVIATAAWCLAACRMLMLALVDMTAFPAIHVHYMQPAFPMLVVAAVASIALVLPRRGTGALQPVAATAYHRGLP